MKRLALILLPICLAAPLAWCNPIDDLFRQAQTSANARQYDDAIRAYERVLAEHPEGAPDNWCPAQRGIAEALARKGDLAEAAKAAHLCLDSARNPQEFNDTVGFTVAVLSALDKNITRANQFLAFVQSGSGANPMDAIGYPALPDRETAFAAMRAQPGDTPDASRLRGFTFLFTGKPKDALAQFADEFRRSVYVQDVQRASQDLTLVGLHAVRGQEIGMDKAVQFVMFGPSGPDGKPNTPDDLADPFTQWLPTAPPVGQGGLAGLTPDDLAALHKVADACQLYASDSHVDGNLRYHAFAVLNRVTIALDNWGAPGQKDWYLKCAYEMGNVYDLLPSILAAGRGQALNLSGCSAILAEIDAHIAATGKSTSGLDKARDQYTSVCSFLGQFRFDKLNIKPLTSPAQF